MYYFYFHLESSLICFAQHHEVAFRMNDMIQSLPHLSHMGNYNR